MAELAELLKDDFRDILALIVDWAADPGGLVACGRFYAILESITVHARFVDTAVAPLLTPFPLCDIPQADQVIRNHRRIMTLLDNFKQAADLGQVWSMHLVILTEIVCPHLILHDRLMLTLLSQTRPPTEIDDLGLRFLQFKDEGPPPTCRADGLFSGTVAEINPRLRTSSRRPGRYPSHHPGQVIPWPFSRRERPRSRTGIAPPLHA